MPAQAQELDQAAAGLVTTRIGGAGTRDHPKGSASSGQIGHRNVANLAPPQDANYLLVLQLEVKHVMTVGHCGCGGVKAAVDGNRRGLVDHWLHPIREMAQAHRCTTG